MTDNEDRVLDWVPRFDKRSLEYPIRSVIPDVTITSKRWTPGPILDQGREGACVGFGWTAEALATPVRVDLARIHSNPVTEPDAFARMIYREAQRIDEWEGENYEGTSVLAGAKVLQRIGTLREYRWAFGVNDVVAAIISTGPVVLGTYWMEGMYDAPGGVLTPSGPIVGGHCYLAVGYIHNSTRVGGPAVVIQNSWGRGWGTDGLAHIAVPNLDNLLNMDGEACVPFRRSYGR